MNIQLRFTLTIPFESIYSIERYIYLSSSHVMILKFLEIKIVTKLIITCLRCKHYIHIKTVKNM